MVSTGRHYTTVLRVWPSSRRLVFTFIAALRPVRILEIGPQKQDGESLTGAVVSFILALGIVG
jgi:hypothetical protein